MSDILRLLSIPWVGTLLGVVGLVLAIYFYVAGRQVVRLSYKLDERSIIGSAEAYLGGKLQIFYHGKEVPRVTSSSVTIWNSGSLSIRKSDIAENDPLRLELSLPGEILQVEIDAASRSVNGFAVSTRNELSAAEIGFEFVDQKDGVRLTVVHTCEPGGLSLKGTVVGLPAGPKRVSPDGIYMADFLAFAGSLLVPVISSSIILVWGIKGHAEKTPLVSSWQEGLFFFGGIAIVCGLLTILIRRLPQNFGWRQTPMKLR